MENIHETAAGILFGSLVDGTIIHQLPLGWEGFSEIAFEKAMPTLTRMETLGAIHAELLPLKRTGSRKIKPVSLASLWEERRELFLLPAAHREKEIYVFRDDPLDDVYIQDQFDNQRVDEIAEILSPERVKRLKTYVLHCNRQHPQAHDFQKIEQRIVNYKEFCSKSNFHPFDRDVPLVAMVLMSSVLIAGKNLGDAESVSSAYNFVRLQGSYEWRIDPSKLEPQSLCEGGPIY